MVHINDDGSITANAAPSTDDPKGLVAVEQVDRDRAAPHVIAPENEKDRKSVV